MTPISPAINASQPLEAANPTQPSLQQIIESDLNVTNVSHLQQATSDYDMMKPRRSKPKHLVDGFYENQDPEQPYSITIHYGNHDPLSSNIGTEWPGNVSVFSENVETYQTITKNGEEVFLHGFSYQNDASYENKIDAYPTSQGQKGIHIGILHGTYSKSNTSDRYTEFILEDLNSKLYHYWALGHIHERQELIDMPQIQYPGNIQGRHFKELGEKGCLLVEGDDLKLNAQFVPTQFIRFEKATIRVVRESVH